VDPISASVLLALAGGAGGEMGRQAWAGLATLVRRPFTRHQHGSDQLSKLLQPVASGEAELAALQAAPGDAASAEALSEVLMARAKIDQRFHAELQDWWRQAQLIVTREGSVHNLISGSVHGPVLQGRDFSGPISFGIPARPTETEETSSAG
jgi:hypothetical protein